jgi:hypothetical protein
MDDRIVDVIKCWSWVHGRDGPSCVFRDMLSEFIVAEPIGRLLFVAYVLSLLCDVVSHYFRLTRTVEQSKSIDKSVLVNYEPIAPIA